MSALSDFVCNSVWALHRPIYESFESLVRRHAEGVRATQEEVDAITAARDARKQRDLPGSYQNRDGVGVVPISGVIARHASQVGGMSQPKGTSLEAVRTDLRAALADPDAHSIMLAIDSPGGSVDGLVDMADEIRAAREVKPVVAHVAGMAASAGYWLAAQASEVYATRGSAVGSIGVVSTVIDDHRRLEEAGVDVKYVTSVEGKAGAGARGRAVSQRDLNTVQAEVDAWHERFVDAIASGRGVDRGVAEAWGRDGARMHFAEHAVTAGLLDGVRSENEVIESLRRGRAAEPTRGTRMNASENGAPATVAKEPRAVTPTSARDLREAYPEAVAQIEQDAVRAALSKETLRVSAIATACDGQATDVVAIGLGAIADGSDAAAALGKMLRAAPRASVPASATANASPTIDQVRAAAAQNLPVGQAPEPEKRTEKDWHGVWDSMSAESKVKYRNDRSLFMACQVHEARVI